MLNKKLTPSQAGKTIRQFCAYQERCHAEVMDKLFAYGLTQRESDEIIAGLISENYLNEERFARAFVRGKFRMKEWGRVKIKYELKSRQVSEYCIKKGLSEIDEQEYEKTLAKLAEEKLRTLKSEKNIYSRRKKLMSYLLQKGFERELVMNLITE